MTDSATPTADSHIRQDLSIDQRLALKSAATQLQKEFDDIYGVETIERFLHSSYDQFAGRASIPPNFLPLLAERFARQRLRALAKVEGKHHDGKPTVLFLCTHNAGRSQMAMGFFTTMAGDAAVAWSGGSEPGNEVNPAAVAAMAERGIDISREYPKPWTDEIVRAADVIITMGGCGDACPVFPRPSLRGMEARRSGRPERRGCQTDPRRDRESGPRTTHRTRRPGRRIVSSSGRRPAPGSDQRRDALQRVVVDPVVRPFTSLFALDQPGSDEQLHVV